MKSKFLAETNPYLKKVEDLRKAFIRSVASSTAVETGQSVEELVEEMTKELESKPPKRTYPLYFKLSPNSSLTPVTMMLFGTIDRVIFLPHMWSTPAGWLRFTGPAGQSLSASRSIWPSPRNDL